jgi:hypothetical protein
MAVVISESAMRVVIPTTELFIEPAMLKGVSPAPYQSAAVITAFFKSLPTAVLPAAALPAMVLPATAVTVAPSPVLSEGA